MAERLRTAIRQLTDLGVRRLEHLELLLVLGRSPAREWGADEVATALSLPFTSISEALEHLHKHQLLALPDPSRPRYRIADRPELAVLAEIRAAHERDRVQVMNLFFACNLDNLRSFAEAFRVRRKP